VKNSLKFAMVLTGAAALPGMAQEIYRCGDSYAQHPCAGGIRVQTDDTRSASQRAQAVEATRRDAETADALEQARLRQEAQPVSAYIPPSKVAQPATAEKKASPGQARKPGYFTATAPRKPGEVAKKKKAKEKVRPAKSEPAP
jgi:hypothetical protein